MRWGWRLRGCSTQKWGEVMSGLVKWNEHWREGLFFLYIYTAGQIIVWKQQRPARKMRPLPSGRKAYEVWKNWTSSVGESYQGSWGFKRGGGRLLPLRESREGVEECEEEAEGIWQLIHVEGGRGVWEGQWQEKCRKLALRSMRIWQ